MRRTHPPASPDRLPPHSDEAERGVLACCLLNPAKCVGEAAAALQDGAAAFYAPQNALLFSELKAMQDEGRETTLFTLRQRLADHGAVEQAGGESYLASLPDQSPSEHALPEFLRVVKDKATARRLIRVCTEAAARAYDANGDLATLLGQVERDVLAVRPGSDSETAAPKELVLEAIGRIEAMWQSKGGVTGLATGFADLDALTGGLQRGEMTTLCALTSRGKTALAMNIAEHALLDLKVPVLVFSLEMRAPVLVTRFICSRARVNLRDVRRGFLAERDMPKLTAAASRIQECRMVFEDRSDLTLDAMRAKARMHRQRSGVELVVVDYIGLVSGGAGRRDETKEQEVNRVALGCKAMAMELGVPVLALSQLNEQGKLRDSRAVGQHSDNVWRLRAGKGDEDAPDLEQDAVPMDLLVQKHRNGPTGIVKLVFFKCYTRFESAAKTPQENE